MIVTIAIQVLFKMLLKLNAFFSTPIYANRLHKRISWTLQQSHACVSNPLTHYLVLQMVVNFPPYPIKRMGKSSSLATRDISHRWFGLVCLFIFNKPRRGKETQVCWLLFFSFHAWSNFVSSQDCNNSRGWLDDFMFLARSAWKQGLLS